MPVITKNIGDNKLVKSDSTDKSKAKEYFGINVPKVFKGVEDTSNQEIVKTDEGFIKRNVIESQAVYDIAKQKHHNWFILDLETGKRGYFPGCIIVGNTTEECVLYDKDTNEEITTIPQNSVVKILNIDTIKDDPPKDGEGEYHYIVEWTPDIGYVKRLLKNIRYHDPM